MTRITGLLLSLSLLPSAFSAGVRVSFDPARPEVGPFPTDFLTVPDTAQRNGLRVNLPLPDCKALPSDCGEIGQLNLLDGFNPNTRITIKFTGPINPDTLRGGVFYMALDPVLPNRFNLGAVGSVTPINQPIWDPATNTAYAKPDSQLETGRRYLIIVTDKVRDLAGDPVLPDDNYTACITKKAGGDYCAKLSDSMPRVNPLVGGNQVVSASMYTTVAASAWFEQVLPLIDRTPTNFKRTGANNLISFAKVKAITEHAHTGTNPDKFTDNVLPATPELINQLGIGSVALGSFQSPRFSSQTLTIPLIPTLSTPQVVATDEVFFHVYLPKTPAPVRGYPVIIAGHGYGDDSFGIASVIAAANAVGYAVIGMNAVGHGGGPKTTIQLTQTDGTVAEFPAPGRAVDIDGNNKFDNPEGCIILIPGNPVGGRDCFRQTVADYLQLIHAIRTGIDLDGNGTTDLDPTNINYYGQSYGGGYGALLTAVSPDIKSAVLNVPPGSMADTRLSVGQRPLAILALATRQPSLLNKGADFVDDIPLRYQDVKVRTTPGSAAIQEFIERLDWLEAPGSSVMHAGFMKQATLPGQNIKRVLFQFALGDQTVANPSTSWLIRSAYMWRQVSLYRHDIARSLDPTLPINPHTFLVPFGSSLQTLVGFSALQQGIAFIASGTELVPDANSLARPLTGKDLFETPAFLPEQ